MTSALQNETGGTVLFGLGKTLENRKGVAVEGSLGAGFISIEVARKMVRRRAEQG